MKEFKKRKFILHKMPFGKHRGERLPELPDDYLEWLIKTVDLREPLKAGVELEWRRRQCKRVERLIRETGEPAAVMVLQ